MLKVLKNFILKTFFFQIDKEERDEIREKVMLNDHKVYKYLLPIIMFAELIILVFSFINHGVAPDRNIENIYRGFYAGLFVACFIYLLLVEHFYKTKNTQGYFVVIGIFLLTIMLWGVGISLLDSYVENSEIITYYAVALIGSSAFLTLEPWVGSFACLVASITYDIVYYTVPGFNVQPTVLFLSSQIIICGICIISSIFNFTRRVDAIRLEMKVSNMNESLIEKALVDDLTRVYNRRYLTEHIDDPLNYSENGSGVMMLDIDHFKNLNDTYGHQVGDECLSLLGIAINNLIRDKDAYCVRYGGEEFLIFFKNISKGDLEIYAETLRHRIEKMKVSISGGVQIKYTISAGLAKAVDGVSYNNLINQADEALYRAKETRNTISF